METGKIFLDSRKILNISGVIKIIRFNEEEFLIDTNLGCLKVKGKKLTLGKLDNNSKELCINGSVDSLMYLGCHKETSLVKRIFK